MSADTDTLDAMTDAQLNELFAVDVAGLQPFKGDLPEYLRTGKHYTADANAVLPWLERHWVESRHLPSGYNERDLGWRVRVISADGLEVTGIAPTFPRAAVIALIRAKRAAK